MNRLRFQRVRRTLHTKLVFIIILMTLILFSTSVTFAQSANTNPFNGTCNEASFAPDLDEQFVSDLNGLRVALGIPPLLNEDIYLKRAALAHSCDLQLRGRSGTNKRASWGNYTRISGDSTGAHNVPNFPGDSPFNFPNGAYGITAMSPVADNCEGAASDCISTPTKRANFFRSLDGLGAGSFVSEIIPGGPPYMLGFLRSPGHCRIMLRPSSGTYGVGDGIMLFYSDNNTGASALSRDEVDALCNNAESNAIVSNFVSGLAAASVPDDFTMGEASLTVFCAMRQQGSTAQIWLPGQAAFEESGWDFPALERAIALNPPTQMGSTFGGRSGYTYSPASGIPQNQVDQISGNVIVIQAQAFDDGIIGFFADEIRNTPEDQRFVPDCSALDADTVEDSDNATASEPTRILLTTIEASAGQTIGWFAPDDVSIELEGTNGSIAIDGNRYLVGADGVYDMYAVGSEDMDTAAIQFGLVQESITVPAGQGITVDVPDGVSVRGNPPLPQGAISTEAIYNIRTSGNAERLWLRVTVSADDAAQADSAPDSDTTGTLIATIEASAGQQIGWLAPSGALIEIEDSAGTRTTVDPSTVYTVTTDGTYEMYAQLPAGVDASAVMGTIQQTVSASAGQIIIVDAPEGATIRSFDNLTERDSSTFEVPGDGEYGIAMVANAALLSMRITVTSEDALQADNAPDSEATPEADTEMTEETTSTDTGLSFPFSATMIADSPPLLHRDEPNSGSTVNMNPNEQITVLGISDDGEWYNIEDSASYIGWVEVWGVVLPSATSEAAPAPQGIQITDTSDPGFFHVGELGPGIIEVSIESTESNYQVSLVDADSSGVFFGTVFVGDTIRYEAVNAGNFRITVNTPNQGSGVEYTVTYNVIPFVTSDSDNNASEATAEPSMEMTAEPSIEITEEAAPADTGMSLPPVVIADSKPMYYEPDTNSTPIYNTDPNETITVLELSGDGLWYRIRDSYQVEGWILVSDVVVP